MTETSEKKPTFVDIITQTRMDTDLAIRSVLANRGSALLTFEARYKDRITAQPVGPHLWDTDFQLDGKVFLCRRVNWFNVNESETIYYEPGEGEKETVH